MRRTVASGGLAFLVLLCGAAAAKPHGSGDAPQTVGRQADGSVLLPTGQRITPAGTQLELGGRPNAVALRPGGRVAAVLVASTGTSLRTLDTTTGAWLSSSTAAGTASYAGLAWTPDGRSLLASRADGAVVVVAVDAAGNLGAARVLTLPQQNGSNPYPGGIAVSADGKTAYVALSRDNALGVLDLASGALTRIAVGNAPHSVVLSGTTAWVSNEGGRPATVGDTANDSAGTRIVSDPDNGGAVTGTVSKVDLVAGKEVGTVAVGLHPTALALRGTDLLVVNTNSDSLSVVDTASSRVTRTVAVTPYPGALLGSAPTGVAVLDDGRVGVTLGQSNALAVVDLDRGELDGLVPTAWYPSDVVVDGGTVVVANLRGVGTTADADAGRTARGMGEVGSVSLLEVPHAPGQLTKLTEQVHDDNDWPEAEKRKKDEPTDLPRVLRPGGPVQHVVYVIKENRTYDQLLGDLGRGNGDPSLAVFGKHVAPNTQALATQFPLLDNCFDVGRRSNDGHNWAVQAGAPDYLEKGVSTQRTNVFGLGRGTPPSSGFDALLYLKTGFVWENALRHGLTFENFGEYTVESMPPPAVSDVPSLEAHTVPEYSGFELTTPDVVRAREFLNHLAVYEARGSMPNLITLTLPNDHTGGSNPRYPTPETQVADNDQALGQIVEGISKSSFWGSTAVVVIEDDTQGGPDHVEGHRGPCLVVSPWSRHGGFIDSGLHSQVEVLRTVEQLLGLPPMNALDAVSSPLVDVWSDKADLAPYTALVPDVLAAQNPPLSRLSGMQLLWAKASLGFDLTHLDAVDPALLNRDTWYAATGWTRPYPGDDKVLTPDEVRTRFGTADE